MTGAACQRCQSAIEQGDLRCAVCGQAVAVASETRDKVRVEILRCDECGAAVSYDANVQAPHCAFCDAVMHVAEVEDPLEQSEVFLPFLVENDAAKRAVKSWLGTLGFFRPSDLKSVARVESIKPLWWVGWVCDAEALVSWAADSDYGSRRSAWAPHAGQTPMEFDNILVSASRGLSHKETYHLTGSYNLATAKPEPEGAENATIEQFDVQRSLARKEVVEQLTETARNRAERQHVPGGRHRNVHVAPLLRRLSMQRVSFPAHVMVYRYRGDVYRAVVSGQDPAFVQGNAPLSWIKILAVAGGALAIIILLLSLFLGD